MHIGLNVLYKSAWFISINMMTQYLYIYAYRYMYKGKAEQTYTFPIGSIVENTMPGNLITENLYD